MVKNGMLEIPIELVELHDALVKNTEPRAKIFGAFNRKVEQGLSGNYLTLAIKGREIFRVKPKGDGIVTCYWCGRTLDNSLSRIRGVGPICIERHGSMPGREHIESGIASLYQSYRAGVKKPMGIKKWLDSLPADEFSEFWKKFVEQVDPKGGNN